MSIETTGPDQAMIDLNETPITGTCPKCATGVKGPLKNWSCEEYGEPITRCQQGGCTGIIAGKWPSRPMPKEPVPAPPVLESTAEEFHPHLNISVPDGYLKPGMSLVLTMRPAVLDREPGLIQALAGPKPGDLEKIRQALADMHGVPVQNVRTSVVKDERGGFGRDLNRISRLIAKLLYLDHADEIHGMEWTDAARHWKDEFLESRRIAGAASVLNPPDVPGDAARLKAASELISSAAKGNLTALPAQVREEVEKCNDYFRGVFPVSGHDPFKPRERRKPGPNDMGTIITPAMAQREELDGIQKELKRVAGAVLDLQSRQPVKVLKRIPVPPEHTAYKSAKMTWEAVPGNVDAILDAEAKIASRGKEVSNPPSRSYSEGEKIAAYTQIVLRDHLSGANPLKQEYDEFYAEETPPAPAPAQPEPLPPNPGDGLRVEDANWLIVKAACLPSASQIPGWLDAANRWQRDAVKSRLAASDKRIHEPQPGDRERLELAWGIIANVNGGQWAFLGKEWEDRAIAWREDYFASHGPKPHPGPVPAPGQDPDRPRLDPARFKGMWKAAVNTPYLTLRAPDESAGDWYHVTGEDTDQFKGGDIILSDGLHWNRVPAPDPDKPCLDEPGAYGMTGDQLRQAVAGAIRPVPPVREKPPLGLTPDYIWREHRLIEIGDAIARLREHYKGSEEPPHDWWNEAAEHAEWFSATGRELPETCIWAKPLLTKPAPPGYSLDREHLRTGALLLRAVLENAVANRDVSIPPRCKILPSSFFSNANGWLQITAGMFGEDPPPVMEPDRIAQERVDMELLGRAHKLMTEVPWKKEPLDWRESAIRWCQLWKDHEHPENKEWRREMLAAVCDLLRRAWKDRAVWEITQWQEDYYASQLGIPAQAPAPAPEEPVTPPAPPEPAPMAYPCPVETEGFFAFTRSLINLAWKAGQSREWEASAKYWNAEHNAGKHHAGYSINLANHAYGLVVNADADQANPLPWNVSRNSWMTAYRQRLREFSLPQPDPKDEKPSLVMPPEEEPVPAPDPGSLTSAEFEHGITEPEPPPRPVLDSPLWSKAKLEHGRVQDAKITTPAPFQSWPHPASCQCPRCEPPDPALNPAPAPEEPAPPVECNQVPGDQCPACDTMDGIFSQGGEPDTGVYLAPTSDRKLKQVAGPPLDPPLDQHPDARIIMDSHCKLVHANDRHGNQIYPAPALGTVSEAKIPAPETQPESSASLAEAEPVTEAEYNPTPGENRYYKVRDHHVDEREWNHLSDAEKRMWERFAEAPDKAPAPDTRDHAEVIFDGPGPYYMTDSEIPDGWTVTRNDMDGQVISAMDEAGNQVYPHTAEGKEPGPGPAVWPGCTGKPDCQCSLCQF